MEALPEKCEAISSLIKTHKDENTPWLILTANQRQSRFLQSEIHAENGTEYLLQVRSLDDHIQSSWLEYQDRGLSGADRRLTSSLEDKLIWRKVLSELSDLPPLLNIDVLLSRLLDASNICYNYDISNNLLVTQAKFDDELALLLKASAEVNHFLNKNRLISVAQALKLLSKPPMEEAFFSTVYLYGFAELFPLLISFVHSHTKHVYTYTLPPQNQQTDIVISVDVDTEIEHAAHWAKNTIEAHPSHSIALVVPDLHLKRAVIQKQLLKVIEPNNFVSSVSEPIPQHLDFSAGYTLVDIACIADALSLLNIAENSIELATAQSIIRSRYWGNGYDLPRQKLSAWLEQQAGSGIVVGKLIRQLQRYENMMRNTKENIRLETLPSNGISSSVDEDIKLDSTKLIKLRNTLKNHQKTMRYPAACDIYIDTLQLVCWPGPKILTSFEYQATQSMMANLQAIKCLDSCLNTFVSFSKFKSVLKVYFSDGVFNPELKSPRVHILGLMEASGLCFDHCYIVGLTEPTLPAAPNPNSFLPIAIQKEFGTPKSSPEKEYAYSKALLESLVLASSRCVLSYAQTESDNHVNPSPLLKSLIAPNRRPLALGKGNILDEGIKQKINNNIEQGLLFESVPAGQAPPLKKNTKIRGGAYHLNTFALNPIFAFFKYRLGVDAPEKQVIGLDERLRGSFIHMCFAHLYERCKSKSVLTDFYSNQDTIDEHLIAIARHALTDMTTVHLPEAIIDFETEYAVEVMRRQIELDLSRDHDFEIDSLEQKNTLQIEGISFSIRHDRIDLVDNKKLIIDYKSRARSVSSLVKLPLKEFQLPIYCHIFNEAQLCGIAYSVFDPRSVQYTGIQNGEISFPSLVQANKIRGSEFPEDWSLSIAKWQELTNRCVRRIAQGDAINQLQLKQAPIYMHYLMDAVRLEEIPDEPTAEVGIS